MASEIPSYLVGSIVYSTCFFFLLVFVMFCYAISRLKISKNRTLLYCALTLFILLGWLGAVLFLSKIGFFAQDPLFAPNIMLGFLFLFIILKKAYSSKIIEKLIDKIPIPFIVSIQTYRIVGYGFFVLYGMGLLPAAFAFSAGIGDMVVGIAAPFVAAIYFFRKVYPKKLAIIWNILGILDLVIAIGVGIFAYPRPIQVLPTEVSTELLSLYPLAIIPLFAVPLAILLHFLSIRSLNKKT